MISTDLTKEESILNETYPSSLPKCKKDPNYKDIILVLCPPWGIDTPPTGPNYLLHHLHKKGFSAEFFDLNLYLYNKNPELHEYWDQNLKTHWTFSKELRDHFKKDIKETISNLIDKTKVIGFSAYQDNIKLTIEIAKYIRKINKKIKIIVGGPSCLVERERKKFQTPYFDYIVIGEGEETLSELISAIKSNRGKRHLASIPGVLAYGNEQKFKKRDPLDLNEVTKLNMLTRDYKLKDAASLFLSKGCIGKCTFCNDRILMGKFRTRSPEQVFEEILDYTNQGIRKFGFNDLLINGNIPELEKLCDLIIKRGLDIEWIANAIPMKNMTYNILKKIRQAGGKNLMYGIETGSNRILKDMKKFFTVEIAEEVLRNSNKAGIRNHVNFIVGYPNETEEDFQLTLDFISKNHENIYEICVANTCCVLYNSELMNKRKQYGIILPKNNSFAEVKWYSKDKKNNYEIRQNRLKILIDKAKQHGIEVYQTNLGIFENKAEKTITETLSDAPPALTLVLCPPSGVLSPSYGIASLLSYLKKQKLKISFIDMNIEIYNKVDSTIKRLWEDKDLQWSSPEFFPKIKDYFNDDINAYAEKIINSTSGIIAFSVNHSNILISYEIAKKIKKMNPGLKIIFGGPGVTISEERSIFYDDKIIDVFIIGYGEKRLLEVTNRLIENSSLKDIKEIIFKEGNGNYFTNKISYKEGISSLEEEIVNSKLIVDFDFFDIDNYKEKVLPLLFSTGCIGRCAYCSDTVLMGKYRCFPAGKIFNQILSYTKKYNRFSFDFNDLAINGNTKELEKLCDLIIESKIKISWSANAIPKKDLDLYLLKKLKDAGCSLLRIGIETGSSRILNLMNKYSTPEIGKRILRNCRSLGIKTSINIIVGFPGETEKDFQETLTFIEKNKKYISEIGNLSTCLITPLSSIEETPGKFNVILPEKDHWKNWEDDSGNNNKTRKEKAFRLKKFAEKLDIPVRNLNSDNDNINCELNTDSKKILEKKEIMPKEKEITIEKDILLVNPPPWGTDNPPIGLAYLSSYLESRGIKVEIFDFNIDLFNKIDPSLRHLWHFENKNFWREDHAFDILRKNIKQQIGSAVERILKSPSPLIGFSVVDPKERITIELIKEIKKKDPSKIIILGGPACSTEDSRKIFIETIPDLIDAYVINEGEEALFEIIGAYRDNSSFEKIPGVLTYKGGEYSQLKERGKKDINMFIFPSYNGFALDEYTTKTLTLVWSRGCIANCAFCKIKGLWKGYQFRNPEDIVKEVEYHSKINKITQFTIADPTINGDLKKLERVCDLIIKKGLNIRWFGQGIPSKGMTFQFLKKMKDAGCYKLEYGVESGSDKILKVMRKPYTREIIEETLKNTYHAGIPVFIFIIIGFPGETEDDFQKTMDLIKKNKEYITAVKSVNMLHLIDDTDVFEKKEEFGIKIIDPESRHIHWVADKGKNTYDLRKERTRRILKLLKELDIPMLETNLKEGKESKMKKTDEKLSIEARFNLFKEDISKIDGTLYHPNPEQILKKKKQNSEYYKIFKKISGILKLIDGVDIGIKKSEIKHDSFDTWGKKTGHITSSYGDEDNIANPSGNILKNHTHWRDFAMTTGVILNIGFFNRILKKRDAILKIKTYDNAYNQGQQGHPTHVYISNDGSQWFKVGQFTLKGDERWIIYSFKIDNVLLSSDKLYVKLDDCVNYNELKTGKKISWIKLYRI